MAQVRRAEFGRPGWALEPDLEPSDELLRLRRWRILRSHMPNDGTPVALPSWVQTPEQFVGWLATRLTAADLRAYFRELEDVAKRTYDLEMLRFARRYRDYW
jgi:hypothetical protein